MRKAIIITLLVSVFLTIATHANAALLNTNAQAMMTSGWGYSTTYMPIGTAVNASVTFDVEPGAPSSFPAFYPAVSSATGTFVWNDSVPQVFSTSGQVIIRRLSSSGEIDLEFEGTGPTIDGLIANNFTIRYNLGVNPFTTTNELSDLLLSSTIERLRIGVYLYDNINSGNYGDLATDVSGSVSIPEPATLSLLALGGLLLRKRK